ncbi:MAG: RtcB family protein [Rhodocyclaceae bacterium]|nr:RtcB family protein [Rhodocyclaceae bacterium]
MVKGRIILRTEAMDEKVREQVANVAGLPGIVAEEAPLAYKDVGAVVDASDRAGLARKVARLAPLVCIKG